MPFLSPLPRPRLSGSTSRRKRPLLSRPRIEPLENRTLLSLDLLGQWNGGGSSFSDGWAVDDLAFIGHYGRNDGIHILDVSDPTNPMELSTFRSSSGWNDFRDVEVQWQLVNEEWRMIGYFSSDVGGGLVIADVTDPYNPTEIFRITSAHGGTNTVHTLSIEGDVLFEADSRTTTIRAFDVRDPANPRWIRNIQSTVGAAVHEVTSHYGFLVTAGIFGTSSAEIFDVTRILEPGNPVGFLGVARGSALGPNNHTTWVSDDGLYMATARETGGGSLAFWDISNLATPVKLWDIAQPTSQAFSVHQVIIRDNYVFVSWYQAGIYVYDISDPANPVEVGSYDTFPGSVSGFDGAWGVYNYWGDYRIYGFDIRSGLFIFYLNPEGGPGPGTGGNFEGSGSRAVRGRGAEGRGVESLRSDQLARVDGDALTLTLGAENDTVHVTRGNNGTTIDVTINGTRSFSYDASPLRQLNVRGLEGDDRVILDPNLGLGLFLDGGPGDDLVEGWRDDYVNPNVMQSCAVHAVKLNPYQAIAIERFAHTQAVTGITRVLDNHAHEMIQHAANMGRSGTGILLAATTGHAQGTALLDAGTALATERHGVAPANGITHQWGLPKQVLWHKPG